MIRSSFFPYFPACCGQLTFSEFPPSSNTPGGKWVYCWGAKENRPVDPSPDGFPPSTRHSFQTRTHFGSRFEKFRLAFSFLVYSLGDAHPVPPSFFPYPWVYWSTGVRLAPFSVHPRPFFFSFFLPPPVVVF